MTHPNLPTPKFTIGQTVWYPGTHDTTAQYPCPDCLGTRKWTVTTPAGLTLSTDCQRCATHYRTNDMPSLSYRVKEPAPRQLTIGSIQINTAPYSEQDGQVSYMCPETGVGSGQVYQEKLLCATEEEAREIAQAECDVHNIAVQITPAQTRAKHLSHLTLSAAVIENARCEVWRAWWAYRHLKEDLEEVISGLTNIEAKEDLLGKLEWDKEHRDHPPLVLLINAIRESKYDELREITDKFSDIFKGEPL